MKQGKSKEAYFERLNELADSKKPVKNESRGLGTLVDYKRAADGVAYGIVKENHHYYVKKGGLKEKLNESDFVYIGGAANHKEYQYPSLGEAEKQRNLLLRNLNEAFKLNEGAAEEIDQAEEKLGDLDAATAAAEEPVADVPDTTVPIPDDSGEENTPPEDMPVDDIPAPEGGEEAPAEDLPVDDTGEEGGDLPVDGGEEGGDEAELSDEIKEYIGKAGQKAQSMNLDNDQIEGYIKEFLGYFKKDLARKFDPKEREALADETIIKVEVGDDGAEKDLEASADTVMPDEQKPEDGEMGGDLPMEEGDMCAECGGFGKYAESRGYSMESMQECGNEEMANVVSGYANAYDDGQNEGDFKLVALLVNPEIIDTLKNEYGHEDYADQLTPYNQEMNEEDVAAQIAELWNPDGVPADGVEVMPEMVKEEEEIEIEEPEEEEEVPAEEPEAEEGGEEEIDFGAPADNLGVSVAKPDGAEVEIGEPEGEEAEAKVEIKADTVNLTVNEGMNMKMDMPTEDGEEKLRAYIRSRLQEKTGMKKSSLLESKKSPTLKKLDALIDKQFQLHEGQMKKKIQKK